MDWLTFIPALIKSLAWLAWPVLVLVIVYWTPRWLRRLISRLVEINFPGGSAKFAREMEKAEEVGRRAQFEQLELSKPLREPQEAISYQEHLKLAPTFPEALVLRSFNDVEEELRALARRDDPNAPPLQDVEDFAQFLDDEKGFSPSASEWFRRLERLRNIVRRSGPGDITPMLAVEYHKDCEEFIDFVKRFFPRPTKGS